MAKCANCGAELQENASFCMECGEKVASKNLCPQCGAELPSEAKFCLECGAKISTDGKIQSDGGSKEMNISEAADAIKKLKPGESITIVLDSDVARITDKLKDALSDVSYLEDIAENVGVDIDELNENHEELSKFLNKYAKKVNLDLSQTNIKQIDNSAFSGCRYLTNVTIPNGVTTIGEWAFSGCVSLASINIPNSVTTIGEWAFLNCTSIKSINIPNSVTKIGRATFLGCTSLATVTMSDGVTTIAKEAFKNCTSIKNITLPNSITTIEKWAFEGCESLTSMTIPNSIIMQLWG